MRYMIFKINLDFNLCIHRFPLTHRNLTPLRLSWPWPFTNKSKIIPALNPAHGQSPLVDRSPCQLGPVPMWDPNLRVRGDGVGWGGGGGELVGV